MSVNLPGAEQAKLPGMRQSDEIRHADIQRIVAERLHGFATRQKIRELLRMAKRKKKPQAGEGQQEMFQ